MVFHSLEEQIAVIDRRGVIIDVNAAWGAFGEANGIAASFVSVGSNYLSVLQTSAIAGDALATEAEAGIMGVIEGGRSGFYLEYPCHSPERQRWFMMRVTRLKGSTDPRFVIAHYDITQRRLAEEHAVFLSRHDPLTGVANRRRFDEFLHEAIQRCARNGRTLCLLELDLDYFKSFNDERGHPAGDACLVGVAEVLKAHTRRPDDLAARLGGDEFAVVLGETDPGAADAMAEEIRRAIEALGFACTGGLKRVTASVGGVYGTPGSSDTADGMLIAADRMLYRAKAQGRNRIATARLHACGKET